MFPDEDGGGGVEDGGGEEGGGGEEVVVVPPLPDLTMTEYILPLLPVLPPSVMVPAEKDFAKRRRVVSVVTRFCPLSVKAFNHEGFELMRLSWATYTVTVSLTVKRRKVAEVAPLSLLSVRIYADPFTFVGTVLKVYVRSRYTLLPAWIPDEATCPLAAVTFVILSAEAGNGGGEDGGGGEEVVVVPPLPDLTMTEYILPLLPVLPPSVMVPAEKDFAKRRRVVSVVTRFCPLSVKAFNHEGFELMRLSWATYTVTVSLTVKRRKVAEVAPLSLLSVRIYADPFTFVGTVLKVYVRSRYTLLPAWIPDETTCPLAAVTFVILSAAETGAQGTRVINANKGM